MTLPTSRTINVVSRVVWLWALLLAAVACLAAGLSQGWHVLTGLGVVIFVLYAYLNGRPAGRVGTGAANPINPATGLAIVPGSHTDSEGHHTGSDG